MNKHTSKCKNQSFCPCSSFFSGFHYFEGVDALMMFSQGGTTRAFLAGAT